MNGQVSNMIAHEVKRLYREDHAAEALFDWFSTRERNPSETTAERASSQADVEYKDIIRVFRELETIGCGKVLMGRKGFSTRIKWDYKVLNLAKVAQGEDVEIVEIDPADTASDWDDDQLVTHYFQLRSDLRIEMRLPDGLSKKEAERLAAFIQTLPFE